MAFLIFGGEEVVIWEGLQIIADTRETGGFLLYFLGECRAPEPIEIDLISGLVRDNGFQFLDVGANGGLLSLYVLSRYPQSKVLAVEPDPRMIDRIRKNIDLNQRSGERIMFVQAAAGISNDEIRFVPGSLETPEIGRVVRSEDHAAEGSILVRAWRMDDLCDARQMLPDVAKIDVEGFEDVVLEGMTRLFQQKAPKAILVEVHGFAHPGHEVAFTNKIYTMLLARYRTVQRLTRCGLEPISQTPKWQMREHFVGLNPVAFDASPTENSK